ncbi:MAG TPA: alpha/beta fold hydrolase [Candidatus Acidoferrum sp.]|jgi:alpha-beta hydrolase superfamily lysophospholipase|nr:alpha/beta fold hydrolase [Candidatus Acidoferrum sp.]
MRKLGIAVLGAVLLCLVGSALAGRFIGPGVLHPLKVPVSGSRLVRIDEMLQRVHAVRVDFPVTAPDGAVLHGWRIRAATPNGSWLLLFHGVGDNRTGTGVFAEFLLSTGYSVVMMDSRAHGESGGDLATYGWKERYDTASVVNALESSENVRHVFALGVSMGAAIALQSAAVDSRIEAVVAEDPLANLREISYDYAGLHRSPLLGKTLFRPATIEALHAMANAGRFDPNQVSPEGAVALRAFPVLLICGTADRTIPCRHARMIFNAAGGPKELWIVQGAQHASAYGQSPAEYQSRVLNFLSKYAS